MADSMILPSTYRGNAGAATVPRPTVVLCPTTADLVPTGVYVSRLLDIPRHNLLPFCPSCGADHEWHGQDGAFAGE